MVVKFTDIAFECKMSSNQMDAIRVLLCLEKETVVDNKTLKMFLPDFPQSFREWFRINNPEAIFFSGPFLKISDNTEYSNFI